jgi:hypothetical protein
MTTLLKWAAITFAVFTAAGILFLAVNGVQG